MASLLQGSLANIINDAVDFLMYDVTYHVVAETSDGTGGFTETETDSTARGFIDEKSEFFRERGNVPSGDIFIGILQPSIPLITAAKGDSVTARGVKYEVIRVKEDPAKAMWNLQCRPK